MELTFYVRGSKSSGRVQALPRVTLEEGETEFPLGTVNLSRSGENPDCWYGLEELWRHDGHAPGFDSFSSVHKYVGRVCISVVDLVASGEVDPYAIPAQLDKILIKNMGW